MGLNILEILSVTLATYVLLKFVYWLNWFNCKKHKPYITDQKKRAEVPKQHFSIEEVIFLALELDEEQARC